MLDASVQGTSILQMFCSISFEDTFVADGFEVTEERFTGSATATDVFGSDSVDLTWDVALPSEIHDCSL